MVFMNMTEALKEEMSKWLPALYFHGIPECENEWITTSVSVSFAFPWALSFQFISSYSNVLGFVLSFFYFIALLLFRSLFDF